METEGTSRRHCSRMPGGGIQTMDRLYCAEMDDSLDLWQERPSEARSRRVEEGWKTGWRRRGEVERWRESRGGSAMCCARPARHEEAQAVSSSATRRGTAEGATPSAEREARRSVTAPCKSIRE
eukprot:6189109-Pleurochrysis_carterae.AAC.7